MEVARKGALFALIFQIAFAPAFVLAEPEYATTSAEESNAAALLPMPVGADDLPVLTDIVEIGEAKIEQIMVALPSLDLIDVALRRLGVEKDAEAGVADAVTYVEDGREGEQVIRAVEAVLPESLKKRHAIFRFTDAIKEKAFGLVDKIAKTAKFVRHEVRTETRPVPIMVGVTRMVLNANVLAAVYYTQYMGGAGGAQFLENPLIDIPLRNTVLFDGNWAIDPNWQAAFTSGFISFLFTILVRKTVGNKVKEESQNLYGQWLVSPPSPRFRAHWNSLLKAAWSKSTQEERNAVIHDLTTTERWNIIEVPFLGIPLLVLAASGYYISSTFLGFDFSSIEMLGMNLGFLGVAVNFVSGMFAGLVAQKHLDTFQGKFQKLNFLTNAAGSAARRWGITRFYLQGLAISLLSTTAAVLTVGADPIIGWTAAGTLGAAGFILNRKVSRKLSVAEKACGDLIQDVEIPAEVARAANAN